ncbi:MAG TPA: DUF3540 domain-containing protein [Polyangiaceae bacterium]|jgi:hypothetical protein
MTAATVQMLPREVEEELGVVLELDGRRVRVATRSGERWAELAASCLLLPSTGDRVLVVRGGDEAYVLAVLRQRHDGEARLVFDGDVSIEAKEGRLRLAFSALDLVGRAITSKTKSMRLVAETFDTVAGRIYQRAVNFLRRTDELDRVEAKNIDRRAEHLLHLHAENAVTSAEHLVKIDGSQVHVG